VNGPHLASLSNAFIYSAMLVYTLAVLAFAADLARVGEARPQAQLVPAGALPVDGTIPGAPPAPTTRLDRAWARVAGVAQSLTWLAFTLHLAGVATRAAAVGRPPWGNMYEFAVSGSAVVATAYLAVSWRGDRRYLGAFVVGPVLLTLGLAVTVLYTDADQLVPALRSFWLVIHVSVAFVASALFTLGFSATVLQLVQDRRRTTGAAQAQAPGRFMERIPDADALERTAYHFNAIAFPLWTFALMSGAIWAEAAWGRYWGWDPKEVWSFIVWVVYAGYLHARATRGWTGRRAAYLSLVGYGSVLFNFGVVNIFVVGLHSYAGVS
jgi:cytochrome c-type biogenesis protein CcsB